jgi:hypothetical protein
MKHFVILAATFLLVQTLHAQIAQPFDMVIDEIMADPTPVVGLPGVEFLELKNTSGRTISVSGWKLTTSTSTSGAFPVYNLPADSFLVICSASNAAAFASYGKVLAIPSFPALDNDGTVLSLISKEGRIIHAVGYNSSWYQNPVKQDGGWTLEMIDAKNPCTGMKNWTACKDVTGGTPGRKNSADAINIDETPPQLIRTFSIDSLTLVAVFDEPLDSTSAATVSNYSLTNQTIATAMPQAPLYDRVLLKLASPMQKRTVYSLSVNNLKDCKGNKIGTYNTAKVGWAELATQNDLVINEILFNPRPDAFDYVELYNRSNKIIDAAALFISNKSSTGLIGTMKKLIETSSDIFPGEFVVVTEDANSLQHEYLVKNPNNILRLTSLPSYPDDEGTVVLMNAQGLIDEVHYKHDWHFALINNEEGVSLERIDPDAVSQDQHNWHSAASTAGYGTPGYKNSQYKISGMVQAGIEVSPKIFSPDNDGQDDVASINYNVDKAGYVANVSIFDAQGRPVLHFVNNALLGLNGSWTWNGLGENNRVLPVGIYIVCTEIFNLQGKRNQFRNTIVLSRR